MGDAASEQSRARGPRAAREHVPLPGYCLIIQEPVSTDQRRLKSSYTEISGARCWNSFPLRASKFPQLTEQKRLQAKAPLAPSLIALLPFFWMKLQSLYFLSLEPLGQVSTGKLRELQGWLSRHQNCFPQVFLKAKLRSCASEWPGTLPPCSPSSARADAELPGLMENHSKPRVLQTFQWLSPFLMLRSFKAVPHVVVTPGP